jgi:phospholipase C
VQIRPPDETRSSRIDRSHVNTSDQNHSYQGEQLACDKGLMDKFVENSTNQVMEYFDGNTVTALWNYATHYAISDNSFCTTFGPSTVGALNLISGNTHGAIPPNLSTSFGPDTVDGTEINDSEPLGDIADTYETITMTGTNVGNLLNAKNITWGWFQGGFDNPSASHTGSNGQAVLDYIPHHEPFQYYASTANPQHKLPTSVAMIGHTDQANHQYDLVDFTHALAAHNLPAVTFLKAAAYQDGHAGYSDPLLEQTFVVNTINSLMQSPAWNDMVIIIAYDDSDGWYDHVMPPIVNQSQTPFDALSGNGTAGTNPPLNGFQGRAGRGPRIPLLVISPFAKHHYVDHSVTDQTSILRFIEDNWNLGRMGGGSFDALAGSLTNMLDFEEVDDSPFLLDPNTGEPL